MRERSLLDCVLSETVPVVIPYIGVCALAVMCLPALLASPVLIPVAFVDGARLGLKRWKAQRGPTH